MAVVPMKRLELFALRRDRKAILGLLQRRGVVEVGSTQASGEVFRQADTSQAQQELETQARLLEQAVELLDHTVPVKKGMLSFLAGRKPVTWEEYQRQGQEAPALLEQAREILRLGKQVTDSEAQAQRLEAQLETLKPWMALDLPLDAKGTGSTRVFLGSFPQALEEGALKAQLAQRLPQVSGMEAEVLSCQAQQTCVFLVCLRQDAAQVEEALRTDFQCEEGAYIQAVLKSAPKFGQWNSPAEDWVRKLCAQFSDLVVHLEAHEGEIFIPGMFSWSKTLLFGSCVGATPDGRRAGTAINHGANPMPGSVPNGAMTTMSEAIVAAQCGMGNTSPFQLELDPGITQAQGGVEKVMALLKTHLQQGGTLINVNIVDAQKVRAAHKNPELYPDLVVRVTGFTAYFITLSPEFRQLVVDRMVDIAS